MEFRKKAEVEFWQAVYVAAIESPSNVGAPWQRADLAVEALRERIPADRSRHAEELFTSKPLP